MRFEKPEVGRVVTVITKPFYPKNVKTAFHNLTTSQTGVVLKSDKRDDPLSFRMATGKAHFPIAVISLGIIESINYSDGSSINQVGDKLPANITFTVKGSKGDEYLVTKTGNEYSCSCKGYGFNKKCKHINNVKEKELVAA